MTRILTELLKDEFFDLLLPITKLHPMVLHHAWVSVNNRKVKNENQILAFNSREAEAFESDHKFLHRHLSQRLEIVRDTLIAVENEQSIERVQRGTHGHCDDPQLRLNVGQPTDDLDLNL